MSHHEQTIGRRQKIRQEMIGGPVPRLWCPPLTHYKKNGQLDEDRMTAHWVFMLPHVNAFLLPGSTSEGWEMTDDEVSTLLDFALEFAERFDIRLLIGALKTTAPDTCEMLSNTVRWIKEKTGIPDTTKALTHSRVCGFTVCPPHGTGLTQDEIQAAMKSVLDLGLPTALYQLPQITGNEMSPGAVFDLAEHYPNLIFLKDSSGKDTVALEDKGKSGIWFMRGAEGDYAKWLKESGGPYDGLLVSTANCFARQLRQLMTLLEENNPEKAVALSNLLTDLLSNVFDVVDSLPDGNPFTNANKAIDHFMGYGQEAERISPPMLHAGIPLPAKVIHDVGSILNKAGLMPQKGYLDHRP
jgi:dihydrodipicolinate synthase/N-acetylneuraminate lyase